MDDRLTEINDLKERIANCKLCLPYADTAQARLNDQAEIARLNAELKELEK